MFSPSFIGLTASTVGAGAVLRRPRLRRVARRIVGVTALPTQLIHSIGSGDRRRLDTCDAVGDDPSEFEPDWIVAKLEYEERTDRW